jgi:pimeloyl-ACP methyl ester carboxylesterase
MPLAHINHQLEEHFIVVHWDQRGAGKSNPRNFDPSTMSFERYLEDARELTEYLKGRFNQDRIFLAGHSWGTQVGLHLVHRHPEHYAAFISVGQVVHTQKAHIATRSWLESEIRRTGESSNQARNRSRRDLAKLEALGPAPYPNQKDYATLAQLVDRYKGGMDWGFGKMAKEALRSPFYGLSDYSRWLSGAQRGSGPMWPEYYQFDNFKDVGRIEVPIYFIAGDKDWNTPLELTREYHDFLVAPAGKELIIIKGTAHSPFLAKPEEFAEILETIRNRHLPDS